MIKIGSTIYTDVFRINGKLCCLWNKIHPKFKGTGRRFTSGGKIYEVVKRG